MSSNQPSRVSGMVDQAIGTAKEKIGQLTGNYESQGEGAAQRSKGETEDNAARLQNKADAKTDSYLGSAKQKVGEFFNNDQAQAEGAARQAKGDLKDSLN